MTTYSYANYKKWALHFILMCVICYCRPKTCKVYTLSKKIYKTTHDHVSTALCYILKYDSYKWIQNIKWIRISCFAIHIFKFLFCYLIILHLENYHRTWAKLFWSFLLQWKDIDLSVIYDNCLVPTFKIQFWSFETCNLPNSNSILVYTTCKIRSELIKHEEEVMTFMSIYTYLNS